MDNSTIKKKLSTYVCEDGKLRNVSDELLGEILNAWEEWSGTAKDFYKTLGFTHRQMASLIGKAKKLKREGYFGTESFKEVQIEGYQETDGPNGQSYLSSPMIELDGGGKVIRFPQVSQLLEYLQAAS